MSVTPVNYRKQDASPEALAADADYVLQIVDFYLSKLPDGGARLLGRRVLELGPGHSLGTAVLLACHGAKVTVADRYLAPWDDDYHRPFYEHLLSRLRAERPHLSPDPVLALLEAGAWVPDTVEGLHLGTEDLGEVESERFDIVLSNAVFEHVGDVPRAWATLARITRRGGLGVHQVDFRDHRDFSRPLEYMTLSNEDFNALFAEVAGECGNRWRPGAMQLEVEAAGFDVLEFEENMSADEAYLEDLVPRLHADCSGQDENTLRPISGCFVMRRRVSASTEYPVETDSLQTLAHSRARYAFVAPFVAGARVLDVGCGAGLGTRELLAAGAASVTGLDVRPEALELARAADPRGDGGDYLQHDLEQPLPFPDGSFDVVVGLEVLEHVNGQRALLGELHRVLTPAGQAFVSVPNKPFEEFWTEMAGEPNPYHVHVPDLEEFVGLLDDFAWVEFHGQVDVVASLVLPLDAGEGEVTTASLSVPASTPISDRGTITVVARCHRTRPNPEAPPTPRAFAYGDHQDAFGGAVASNQAVVRWAESAELDRFTSGNRLKWQDLAEGESGSTDAPAPGPEPRSEG